MMNVRAFSLAGFGGGLASLGLFLAGCGGAATAPGSTDPGGTDPGGAGEGCSFSFN
ncbi:MAG: hypothetical protein IIB60_03560 [Planctomycetes bacterium]|nr:hypothetical protein [Planctomycetota bacterium]